MSARSPLVTLHEVFLAAARIAPHVRRSPLERSAALSEELGADVWLKLECLQRTGSFKLRGALNRLLTLTAGERERGVLTCSAGNHGLGLAEAARLTGTAATIVVPEDASSAKVEGLRRLGSELLVVGADYDEAEARAPEIARERGSTFVSPYNDPAVVAGAGTVALEVLRELPEAGTIVVPVGGGGLAAGTGVVARAVDPALRVIGAQSSAWPAMRRAVDAGRLGTAAGLPSLADGLAGNVEAGSITFPLIQRGVDEVVLVEEPAIAAAMVAFLDQHRLVVEGSGAVGLAALRADRGLAARGPVVLIVSGGNVATDVLARVVAEQRGGESSGGAGA